MLFRRISTLIACALVASCAVMSHPSAQAASSQGSAQALVRSYFSIANAGLKTDDFSALPTVYAPTVTLTFSNPAGVTKVLHGMDKITAWYEKWGTANAGAQLTSFSTTSPMPNVVIDYERADKGGRTNLARCAHIFTVQNGKIISDDWVVYYLKK